MNLDAFRLCDIERKFVYLLQKYHFETVCPDQDYLNVLCSGRALLVNQSWNMTAYPDGSCIEPKIVHFKINYKPWRYDGVMCEDEFWSYARKTAYYEKLRNEKKNYSEAEKARDAKMYADLMELARTELEAYYADDIVIDNCLKEAFGV